MVGGVVESKKTPAVAGATRPDISKEQKERETLVVLFHAQLQRQRGTVRKVE